ncbi:aquaporin-8 isoform X2 [Oryzias melastigma]|uniref:aquaporin-8 isoform X2 n=1 Tax=Oryzias melastigma TaxID=30732 RepID=UPI000CF7D987|nr:aquaporin-8 isoform X2 [Oryzias melastigma]
MEKMDLEDVDSALMEKGKKPAAAAEPPGKFERLYQPCLAELVGTMFFVFIGCVSVIENVPAAGRMQPALVHGLAVAVMVAVMDNISGSHFNPPFTIAIYLCGGMRLAMVVPYLISQLIGGMLGAGMAKLMTPPDRYLNATGAAFDLLKSDAQVSRAIFGEVAMTCLVTMVVLMVAVNGRTKTPLAPFLRRRLRHVPEPRQGLWSGRDGQLLDLPLGVLGGAHRRRPAGCSSAPARSGR